MNIVYFIVQQTMFFAIPLLIVSLGGLFAEKSGITNIALEGIMIMGAFAGVHTINLLGGVISGQLLLIIAIAVSGLVGGLYSLFHAWASIRLKADQTISGTALNLFAPAFCIFLSRAIYGAKTVNFVDFFHIDSVPVLGDIPVLGPLFFKNCYLSTYIGIVLLAAVYFVFKKTRLGLRISACGENPEAAASVGIRVEKMRYCGVILSGVLSGIGGLVFIVPTSTSFSATVAGYGFLALAILILGQWNPIRILLSSFFFGLLKAISSSYSGVPFLSELAIPSEIYKILPYAITLVVLAISSKRSLAPKSLGIIYDAQRESVSKKSKIIKRSVVIAVLVVFSVYAVSSPVGVTKKNAVSNGYGAKTALLVEAGTSVDDKSYMQSIWEGVVNYTDSENITRKYYQAKDNSEDALKKCVELAVKGNADFIIAPSNVFEATIGTVQSLYPDNTFFLFDGEPKDLKTGEVFYNSNTVSVCFAEEQAGFLAGYAIVKDGFRNLGFIGGLAVPSVVRYGYGFLAGCEYAAKELNLNAGDIKIKYNYAGTFNPNPESQAMASAWYSGGVDVIFACAGGLGNSVIKAAENTGKYVVEPDKDMSEESETIITSAAKDVTSAVKLLFDRYNNGTLQMGTNYCLTAKENCIYLPMETSRFRTFSKDDYQKIYSKVAKEEVDIPDDKSAVSADKLNLRVVKVELVR